MSYPVKEVTEVMLQIFIINGLISLHESRSTILYQSISPIKHLREILYVASARNRGQFGLTALEGHTVGTSIM